MTLVRWAEEYEATREEMTRDLALHLGQQVTDNRGKLSALTRLYTGAIAVLFLEFVFLILDLRSR